MLKKILGAGLGWSFGGPIGAILGWWLAGKIGNQNRFQSDFKRRAPHTTSSDFIISMLILASCLIKADQQVKREEIEFVKRFLKKHFDRAMVEEMMMFLKDIQKKDYSLEAVTQQMNQQMALEEKIQILHFLYGISLSDQEIHPKETELIEKLSQQLEIPTDLFNSIKNLYLQQSGDLAQSYRILNVKPKSSVEEIKKSYLDLSMKYHPDKVAHLGEEIRSSAEEKFKIISSAYQKIKQERKF